MLKITSIVLVVSMLAVPCYAQPIVNQTGAQNDNTAFVVTGQVQGVNQVFLPMILSPCLSISPLTPVVTGASYQCVKMSDYTGTQGPSNLIETVSVGQASMFASTMPHFAVSIPVTGTHIAPQSKVAISSLIAHINSISFMTTTIDSSSVSVLSDVPFAGRFMWTIIKALQDKASATPVLFPVPLATLHYSQPRIASQITTIYEKCADRVNAGSLALPGYPYDLIADDSNAWLQMKYPACPAISGYYIKLSSFWRGLKAFVEYQNIDAEAAAIVAPGTYHVSDLALTMPGGQIEPVSATIVVVAIGALIIIAIFPEVGVGWWLLTGAAALQEENR